MMGIGMGELLVILVIALLFVGPEKLPEAAKAIGKGIRQMRKAADNIRETVDNDPELKGAIDQLRSVGEDIDEPRILDRNRPVKKAGASEAGVEKLSGAGRY